MTTDNKTLADVQPGGRVRLGGQAERARFEAWVATQHDQGCEHVMATVSASDDRYQSPVTSSMWSAWQAANAAREGGRINGWRVIDGVRVYSAYAHASILDDQQYVRYEDYLAALSAQPSPGGQGDASHYWPEVDRILVDAYVAGSEGDEFDMIAARTAIHAALAARQPVGRSFQSGVAEWMGQCFLPSLYSNMTERGDRLLEEVLELLQAHGYDKTRVATLVDYVFGRPVGEPAQEVGGVMVTLAGYCWVAGLDMHAAGDAELARINQPEVMDKIRRKQEAKNALHFDTPLPGHAAPTAQAVDVDAVRALLQRRIEQWRSHLPADPGAPGTREIETKGEHDYNNDVRIYREGIAVMEEVLSKTDSQAAGK